MSNILYLVIPCYNEEDVLPQTAVQVEKKMTSLMESNVISTDSKVLFIDDGSTDETWPMICRLHDKNKLFSAIRLAHNSGEQNAYFAGMMTAAKYADTVITIDADLQDDINAVDDMLRAYSEGYEIVYGVRASRKNESFFIRATAALFYKLMKVLGTELIPNHSQYRLMSRRAVLALADYGEVNLFLPALVPLLGFKNTKVYHERIPRAEGRSKYSVKRLFLLAIQAITSFSLAPLRLLNCVGVLFLIISAVLTLFSIVRAIIGQAPGWLWVLSSVWAVGGMTVLSLGIVGEYVGKTYIESKKRPKYFIRESLGDEIT